MPFTDFPGGLTDATQYLSSQNSLNAELTGSVADIGRLVISAQLDFNLKEIICSLLAGRGLKLPNIQICISLNLKELLGGIVGTVQQTLYDALSSLDQAFDRFLDHMKLDAVLGRINNVLAEVTNIANMINFCSAPLDPIQIPNVLEDAMESFLGTGKSLIDRIGTLVPGEIGGCLIDGQFNCTAFDGGLMKKICDNINDLDAVSSTIIADCTAIVADIDDLIDRETSVTGTYDNGGSDLAESPRFVNDGVGVLYNANDEGIQGATSAGSGLWAAYQQLGSYQVTDSNGIVYNNIFELFCDDDLLRILRRTPDPRPEISQGQPVYNYCGEIIGFTKVILQDDPDVSVGSVPDPITDQPGYNAGGLPTNPLNEAISEEADGDGGTTVVNNITNITNETGAVTFVADEAALIALGGEVGELAFRQDNNVTYVNNGGVSGTISDWTAIGGSVTATNLGTGADILNVNAGVLEFRSISSGNWITVTQNTNDIEITADISRYEGTLQTTDATLTEVLFDVVTNPTPAADTTWFLTVTAVGNRSGTADAIAIKMETVVDNNGGTVSVVGAGGNKTIYNAAAATANYDIDVDINANETRVRVQGDTSHTVDWKVRLEYIESP